jgi:signal transduction histidine kinase
MPFALNIRPHLLITVTVAVGAVLLLSAFWELDRSRKDLSHVVHEEGLSLVEAIHQSSVNTILSTEQIEALLAERLLNNAWFIAECDSMGGLTQERLARIARQNHIFRINIFDHTGRRVLSSHVADSGHAGMPPRYQPVEMIGPILRGEASQLVIGLKAARFEKGQRYAVAVRRHRKAGGAIVLNLDAAELLSFRKRIGIGKLIRDLGDNSGIVFAALQDTAGIIAASGNVSELSSFAGDPMLWDAVAMDTTFIRETSFDATTVFEILHPLVVDGAPMGVLRIGLSLDEVRAAEDRMQRRMIVVIFVLGLLASLTTVAIIASRNYQRVQRELQRAEKLSALGELASGVAHEIRNPLNAITMIAQRFQQEFTPSNDAAEYRTLTTVLRTEAERVNGIVANFLRYTRPPRLRLESRLPGEIVTHCATLIEPQMRAKGIEFRYSSGGATLLPLDPDQLTQALLNILLNALEATPKDGTVTLTSWSDHNGAVITVTDTGHGISADTREKIFNLYYTTKPDGTGMGLPMARQIIMQHGGTLGVDSEEGKGTTCRIHLRVKSEENEE